MRRACLLVSITILLTACASQLNLRQQQVYDQFEQCRGAAIGVQLTRVTEDGAFTITGTPGGPLEAVQRCMKEKFGTVWASERRDLQQQPARTVPPSTPPRPVAAPSTATPLTPALAPTPLKRGSEWAYRWETPRGKGTFVYVLDREEVRDGSAWYVLKGPTTELYHRKTDLALALDVVAGEVSSRRSPPQEMYKWPLSPGQEWDQTYTYERPKQRETEEIVATCKTEGPETVTVPAGSFQAFKSTCRNKRTGWLIFESWYAPEVGMFVRDVSTLREGGTRQRELTQYRFP
jgi:hypothetical protein